MKKIFAFFVMIVFLTGCGMAPINPEQQQQFNKTIPICVNDRDCKEKWSAAQVWVARNCGMKMQMVTDTIIQTYNSINSSTDLQCSVIKEPIGNEKYRLLISTGCDNIFGCFPDSLDAALNFNQYVSSVGSHEQAKMPITPPPAIIQKDAATKKLKCGINFVKTNEKAAQILGMKEPQGVVVVSVVQDSVAFKAGLKQGDVILKYGKKVINDETDLQAAIAATKPGSRIPITIWDIHRGEIVITAHFPK